MSEIVGNPVALFLKACEEQDISVVLEYTTGRYVPGEYVHDENGRLIPQEEIPPEHIRQGPKGWMVEVGGYAYVDDIPVPFEQAVLRGITMLREMIAEKERQR